MTTVELPGGAWARFTGRADGDMGHGGDYAYEVAAAVDARRRAVLDLPWTWLRQVHGDVVVRVVAPGASAGSSADAAVTAEPGCALAVLTADCAPVVLASAEGVVGAAHAGWAGLEAGVLERTVEAMRDLGATSVTAVVGPCIRAECYAFGAEDLDRVAGHLGPDVRARDDRGVPALDLPAGVRAALRRVGVSEVGDLGSCTACSSGWYSWRARKERQRQAAVVWR
ncbi:MAG: polyphenol oxidase family protein [Actinomycetota bacterium]|nr:polyphenol oxidase family protein [Actinomycetota bacterium]